MLALTALLATSACTGNASSKRPSESPSPTVSGSQRAAATPVLEDTGGDQCVSPGGLEKLLVERGELVPHEPVTISALELAEPYGIRLDDAWVAEVHGSPVAVGIATWPLRDQRPGRSWRERVPADGAELEVGKRYVIFLELSPERPSAGEWAFDRLLVHYADEEGDSHTVRSGLRMTFGRPCR